jgi:hypothetical protein
MKIKFNVISNVERNLVHDAKFAACYSNKISPRYACSK